MRMTALLASRSVDVMRPAAQPLLQVAASGLPRAPAPLPACALAALRRASSSRSHLHSDAQILASARTGHAVLRVLACLLHVHAFIIKTPFYWRSMNRLMHGRALVRN